jgi:predicted ATPase
MHLESFSVSHFRSINQSGVINVRKRTVLVGRNESGKSNLLLALASLNPPGGVKPLNEVKDYPRDRPMNEFSPKKSVVETTWRLSERQRAKLVGMYPRAASGETVSVSRDYAGTRYVGLPLAGALVDENAVRDEAARLVKSATAGLRRLGGDERAKAKAALERFARNVVGEIDGSPKDWVIEAEAASATLRASLAEHGYTLPAAAETALRSIEQRAAAVTKDEELHAAARRWVLGQLPTLIYVNDYPQLNGHQNIPEFLERRRRGQEEPSDREFEKLMKVAGLDAATLNDLLAQDHERRAQLANRAGAVVTKALRALWTDRQLKVRFNPDGQHFDTVVSDSTAVYDVEINLNERSLGFRWFFSFYIAFAADTQGGDMENAILLLDEPGLHLHAVAQQDLLRHFAEDFKNQILFTTHSPFMIPVDDLDAVRTVNISHDDGTTVTNDPTGDRKTLFPLQTALGFNLTQTLFVGPANLVVEGVTDFWYLSSVAEYLEDRGELRRAPGMVITPAGGAQKVSYMVALLTSQQVRVVVLLDSEKESRRSGEEMVRDKLIRQDGVLYVSVAMPDPNAEADIEDMLDPAVFDQLVRESYAAELAGESLSLNPQVPRIVKRYELAFCDLGMEFHKTRPARLFLRRMGEAPDALLANGGHQRFAALLNAATDRLEKLASSGRRPFE